jgi:hypothetical protein
VRAIDVVFNFSGGLLDLKGFPGHHRPAVSVDTSKPRALLQRLHGDPDDRWIFTADWVWDRAPGWGGCRGVLRASGVLCRPRTVIRPGIGCMPRPSTKPAFPSSVLAKRAGKSEEIAQALVS